MSGDPLQDIVRISCVQLVQTGGERTRTAVHRATAVEDHRVAVRPLPPERRAEDIQEPLAIIDVVDRQP
eukprot:10598240-Alexandrium_andersonii.AAC.1